MEAERERPLKAPLRVSIDGDGQPVVTLTAATRKLSGVLVIKPKATQHQEQIRAYGTVLDLDKLVALDNSYVTAVAQLQSVQARIAASKAALERAQTLSKDNIRTLAHGRGDVRHRSSRCRNGRGPGQNAKGNGAAGVGDGHRQGARCGFRGLRPGIPIERDHAFRSKAATCSDEGGRGVVAGMRSWVRFSWLRQDWRAAQ